MRPESDPIEILRRSDPVSSNRPSPAQEARLRARIEEVIAMDHVKDRPARPAWRRPAVQGLASVLFASAVIAVAVLWRNGGAPAGTIVTSPPAASNVAAVPSATPRPTATAPVATPQAATPTAVAPTSEPTAEPSSGPISPGGGLALCVESYDLTTLAHREFAFDGTVTAIAGDEVTFAINQAYRGATGPSVTLTASGMIGATISSAGGPNLEVGGRYLVAGDDHFAWACGFTQPWDAATDAEWAAALQ